MRDEAARWLPEGTLPLLISLVAGAMVTVGSLFTGALPWLGAICLFMVMSSAYRLGTLWEPRSE